MSSLLLDVKYAPGKSPAPRFPFKVQASWQDEEAEGFETLPVMNRVRNTACANEVP